MHVHFEEYGSTRSDCAVQALSWMGKVPETVPDEDGWKLNRVHYYQEGWLASGNQQGIIGVTFTACHCRRNYDQPTRTNFNLRGHRNEVALVKWNEPYQKLATCDVTGVIFVWIKHEGRWSIELINDRNSQVTDFAWSHDGRMALICYQDGFVLVGSVAGQRYWSSMLNLDGSTITCGIWSPDDQKVMFGTTDGQLIVMSANGAMLAQVTVIDGAEITAMAWSCEKFYLDERDTEPADGTGSQGDDKSYTLAVCFKTGIFYLLCNYDDVCPKIINTGLTGLKMEWCNDGEILAVSGFVRMPNLDCANELRFYTVDGSLRYGIAVPHLGKPVSALTWGHNNKRLFLAAGCHVYTAWVTRKVALLQFLCRRAIQRQLRDDSMVTGLPLPTKLRASIAALFSPTIKGYIPDPLRLREFVCMPPPGSERLHCTMIRHGEETSGGHYMLYLEYLGGLVPLLKGKRASKIRPEFVIFDPKIKTGTKADEEDIFISSESASSDTDSDADIIVEGCGSPRMQRRKRLKKLRMRIERRDSSASQRPLDELLYDDNLPETHKLVEVTSNLWGTKFKLHGLASFLPEDLGHVLYKTSLLHLQPRQMTVSLLELTPDLQQAPQARDPSYNPNQFSESDEEGLLQAYLDGEPAIPGTNHTGSGNGGPDKVGSASAAAIVPGEVYAPPPSRLAGSTETVGLPNGSNPPIHEGNPVGAIEVPVIIERRPERSATNCSPFEIRSLDGSPPQRRSPSLKSRSLSPAEPQVPCASNTLVDGAVDGDLPARGSIYRDKPPAGPTTTHRLRMGNIYHLAAGGDILSGGGQRDEPPTSPRSVVQLAARRLEDVLAIQRQAAGGADQADHGSGRHSSNSSDSHSPPALEAALMRGTDTHRVSVMGDPAQSAPPPPPPRWADKACHDIKYIDDDLEEVAETWRECREAVFCSAERLSAREIMASTQLLAELDTTRSVSGLGGPAAGGLGAEYPTCAGGPPPATLANTTNSLELHKKRLVLAPPPPPAQPAAGAMAHEGATTGGKAIAPHRSLRTRISKELQNARNSLELIPRGDRGVSLLPAAAGSSTDVDSLCSSRSESPHTSLPTSPIPRRSYDFRRGSLDFRRLAQCRDAYLDTGVVGLGGAANSDCPASMLNPSPPTTAAATLPQSASLPTSPVRRVVMPQQKRSRSKQDVSLSGAGTSGAGTKCKMPNSPFLKRRLKSYKAVDSSDEEILLSGDDVTTSENYKNLETFQKAQLNKKLRKVRTTRPEDGRESRESREGVRRSPSLTRKRHLVMHNKAPLWNENSQVYQLDFGGRVTQESAKNFQIEFRGKQVMQFGRIDGNAYTLDFQYPFSAIQAFAVALANVTQRLK